MTITTVTCPERGRSMSGAWTDNSPDDLIGPFILFTSPYRLGRDFASGGRVLIWVLTLLARLLIWILALLAALV
ncbi:hypothetical protein [Bradyrhizobium sp.]